MISLNVSYDGLDADEHKLDMRRLGEAMVGFDRIVNVGLIALSTFRRPKQREKYPLVLRAREPEAGSFELVSEAKPVLAATLPLVHEVFYTWGGDFLWRWSSWVLNMAGGIEKEADPHFSELPSLMREIHKTHAESEDKQRQPMLDFLDRVLPAAKQTVAPIGRSAES